MARKLAWEEGYAIGLHGSFTRDLDLIAVPWVEKPCEPIHLVRRIVDATGLKLLSETPGAKPQGRLVWTLLFPSFGDPRFVDFSVIPPARSGAGSEVRMLGLMNEAQRWTKARASAIKSQVDGKATRQWLSSDVQDAFCAGAMYAKDN